MTILAADEEREYLNPLSILAVDDDATSLLVIRGYLKSFGFSVVTVSGGVEALEILGER